MGVVVVSIGRGGNYIAFEIRLEGLDFRGTIPFTNYFILEIETKFELHNRALQKYNYIILVCRWYGDPPPP